MIDELGLAALRLLDAETAHNLAIRGLSAGLVALPGPVTGPRLATRIAGLDLPNPIGIAAGFDKEARAVAQTLRTGVGFTEIGGVTPRPQTGNPRPRLFRLSADRAVINRFGFNSGGVAAVRKNLDANRGAGVVGVNLGANRDTEDKVADYIAVMQAFAGAVDFFTINVSSPNTERLRDLQGRAALDAVLERCIEARDAMGSTPVFLKIAPDLTDAEIASIAEVCIERGVDAIVATNTTTARGDLISLNSGQTGGLAGRPLFDRSTEVLRTLRRHTGGRVPLIGVGGVDSGATAYAKIKAGAGAVQLYSAMVYKGVRLGYRIALELDRLLAADGFANVAEAVGSDFD